ncbi:hypothetical protein EJ082_01760 [Brevundimonas diminuta]|uniref:hypothetical protein n=1 Tax=Brevundimonas diminuta TaxID=293 RepID=UPI00168BF72B|nr:hypothetical protein [Brevundimonas diminuta]MBD3571703.1 hypothetical protein [Brevundimonas diminuta]
MTVVVSTRTEPVTRPLSPPFQSMTVTVRRLRTPEWEGARDAAQAILRDDGKLLPLLMEHELLPDGGVKALRHMREKSPLQYAVFLSGIGLWLTAVECALVGLISWEGVVDEGTRKPAPITREVLQVLLLDDRMSDQLMNILTEAARLLIVEGKPSGA